MCRHGIIGISASGRLHISHGSIDSGSGTVFITVPQHGHLTAGSRVSSVRQGAKGPKAGPGLLLVVIRVYPILPDDVVIVGPIFLHWGVALEARWVALNHRPAPA